MSRTLPLIVAAAGLLIASHVAGHAQATRTWVSGVGNDVNPCSRTAPCKTFAGAIVKTFINGEINCLDPGAYGAVTITKSITIDCHEIFAGVLAGGINGIIINIAVNANDPLRTARIRNLNIDGAGASGAVGTRTGINGIRIDSANAVFVEDTMIRNFTQQGILDQRTTGGFLFVNNTTVQDNGQAGIKIAPSSGSTRIDGSLSRVIAERNADGVRVGSGARVMIKQSVLSGNSNAGVLAESLAGNSRVSVNDSSITNNGTGVLRLASGAFRLSNNDISFNGTGKSGAGLDSFGNNRVTDNTAPGDAFTLIAQE